MIRIGLVLSLVATALLLAGPLGSRVGLWSFIIGFLMLGLSLLLALVGASLSLVGGIKTGQWAMAVAGIVVGLIVVSVPSSVILSARGAPPIHDITTDPEDPPAFVAVLARRAGARNPVEYGGPAVAAQQRRAFPDLVPLDLPVSPERAFPAVEAAARDLGWEIVETAPAEGRLEATATTPWFGFKDDVVVRVRARGAGSRVDVRSLSRVGVGDLGVNAARVRAFLERLRASGLARA